MISLERIRTSPKSPQSISLSLKDERGTYHTVVSILTCCDTCCHTEITRFSVLFLHEFQNVVSFLYRRGETSVRA